MYNMTAVEWVFDKMLDVAAGNSSLTTQEILEKSNVMFEEQILAAYMTAKLKHVDCLGIDVMKRKVINETQQYYNSTYKGGEK
jgi:hypothetical protein